MEHSEVQGVDGRAVLIAIAALAIGVAVYVFARAPGSAYLFPFNAMAPATSSWFGGIGAWLPSLAHVYGFSLLTAALLSASRIVAAWSCVAWWMVDSLFEIGQHPAISPHLAATLPASFDGIPVLENTAAYFVYGHFDSADLLATAIGAVCAFFTLALLRKGPV